MKLYSLIVAITFVKFCMGNGISTGASITALESTGNHALLVKNDSSKTTVFSGEPKASSPNAVPNSTKRSFEKPEKCHHETNPEKVFQNDRERKICCKDIVKSFQNKWPRTLNQLTDFLRVLKRFNCSQFEEECQRRTYDFSEFNKLAYHRFCNLTKFSEQCREDITKVFLKHADGHIENSSERPRLGNSIETTTQQNFLEMMKDIGRQNLSLDDMMSPCVQAALVDVDNRPKDGFFEMKETQLPFCGMIVWCGFPGSAYKRYEISEWTCTPTRCQANVIILMVTCGILALASTVANTVALVVFIMNRRLRDSQGVYKTSLAAANLLIGLFVFTTAIETMRRMYMPKITLEPPEIKNNGEYLPWLDVHSFDQRYHSFVGFFTTLSNCVSVYTLMIASLDRFMVVFRPLRYNLYTAKKWATKLVIALWVICAIFAFLPIVLPNMEYNVIAGFIETMTGDAEYIILTLAFVIPIFVVIITNIATVMFSRQNAKARPKHIPGGAKGKDLSTENRLARTLLIMVGAYLICLLPLAIFIALHLFLEDLNHQHADVNTLTLSSTLEILFCITFVSNSLWNFFIYNARSAEFREAARKLFAAAKTTLRSKVFRNSARDAKNRRTSAAISNSSQIQFNTISTTGTA